MAERSVGIVGLGSMGASMARALLDAGWAVGGFDVDPERTAALAAVGVSPAADGGALARSCDTLLVSVPENGHLDAVVDVVGGSGASGVLVIDTSTLDPAGAAASAERLRSFGCSMLSSPVSGTCSTAAAGELVILCSGAEVDYHRAAPVLDVLSSSHRLVGSGEEARVLKLAINLLLDGSLGLLGEAVALGDAAGVERQVLMECVNASVIGSTFTGYKTEPIVSRDFTPAASVDLVRKDLGLVAGLAECLGLELPLLDLVDAEFARAQELGHGRDDMAVVVELPHVTEVAR